jgi:Cysteine-rich CPXCG
VLEEVGLHCPCCGEPITVLVDTSESAQEYIEDCEVCCRPMVLTTYIDGDYVGVEVRHEDA